MPVSLSLFDEPRETFVEDDEPALPAPFPWFGGKSRACGVVWPRLGDVKNYVEPFFGSGAMLLGRPHEPNIETINDLDGFVANFWRAVARAPDDVAEHADYPVNENDLHARHAWLVGQRAGLVARLEGDPDWYDAKIAGWWVWGICCWIGSGFCSGNGPWTVNEARELVLGTTGQGVNRKLPHLGGNGQGVNRQLPHLGDNGQGVNRQLPHLGDNGQGRLVAWFRALSDRLARVRVCSGDWSRVCGPSVTFKHGLTGVFLDPPYSDAATRTDALYRVDSLDVAHAVREWAIANGDNPLMRIALCGYVEEHAMPDGWTCATWRARKGFASQSKTGNDNRERERIWFSPHCLPESSCSR